jgi:hypothetical protein
MSTKDMPVFVIKAKDQLAVLAVEAYEDLCIEAGLHDQAAEVRKAKTEIELWQEANPQLVKQPDHTHVPMNSGWQDTGGDFGAI